MSKNKSELILNLTAEEELKLFRLAHQKDITLNQLIEEILEYEIEKIQGKKQLELPL